MRGSSIEPATQRGGAQRSASLCLFALWSLSGCWLLAGYKPSPPAPPEPEKEEGWVCMMWAILWLRHFCSQVLTCASPRRAVLQSRASSLPTSLITHPYIAVLNRARRAALFVG